MSQLPHFSRSLLAVSAAAALCPTMASAAMYYKQANQSTTTWKQLSEWFDQPTGGGNAATTLAGNSFDNQGFTLRTSNAADSFGDASTTLILSSGSGKGLIVRGTSLITVHNLLSHDGRIVPGASGARVTINNLDVPLDNSLTIRPEDDGSSRTLIVSVANLVGAGDIAFGGGSQGGTVQFSATNTASYTGDLLFAGTGPVTLDFQSDFTGSGSLVLADNSRILLDQALSFSRVNIGGSDLAPGTYTFDTLNSAHDTLFVEGGSGSITVVPEPAIGALWAGVCGMLMLKRRSCR